MSYQFIKSKQLLKLPVVLLFLLVSSLQLMAQTNVVTGTVTDPLGEPLIGVNVVLKDNPTVGTITDMDGKFSLEAGNSKVFVFSYIGYAPQEVSIVGKNNIQVQLKEICGVRARANIPVSTGRSSSPTRMLLSGTVTSVLPEVRKELTTTSVFPILTRRP